MVGCPSAAHIEHRARAIQASALVRRGPRWAWGISWSWGSTDRESFRNACKRAPANRRRCSFPTLPGVCGWCKHQDAPRLSSLCTSASCLSFGVRRMKAHRPRPGSCVRFVSLQRLFCDHSRIKLMNFLQNGADRIDRNTVPIGELRSFRVDAIAKRLTFLTKASFLGIM